MIEVRVQSLGIDQVSKTPVVSLQEMEEERRYKVRFLSNPKLHWQRRSLEALRHLAPNVVHVDVSTSSA